jgi:hypothetical protein
VKDGLDARCSPKVNVVDDGVFPEGLQVELIDAADV